MIICQEVVLEISTNIIILMRDLMKKKTKSWFYQKIKKVNKPTLSQTYQQQKREDYNQ